MAGERCSVLQVVTDRDRRGAQVFATDLAVGLVARGFEVETVALADGPRGDALGVDLLGSGARSPTTLLALRRRAAAHDVVVAHGSNTLFACALALAGAPQPFVYRQISDPLFWAGTPLRRARVAAYLRRASGVVALSSDVAGIMVDRYRLPEQLISVIPNAVPGAGFAPATVEERSAARRRFGLASTGGVVGYVGALVPEKGVDVAIEAIAHVPGAHLLVVGDGPARSSLEDLATSAAPGCVTFAGQIEDPRAALQAMDVLVLPSRGGDSMPAVLIEAALSALPCVSTDIGAISEIVADGVTGRIVDVDNVVQTAGAIVDLLDDAVREEYGRRAAARSAERFTIDAVAGDWADAMRSAIRRPRNRTRGVRLPHSGA